MSDITDEQIVEWILWRTNQQFARATTGANPTARFDMVIGGAYAGARVRGFELTRAELAKIAEADIQLRVIGPLVRDPPRDPPRKP